MSNLFNIGDHIKVRRAFGLYSHHGIYIGNNNVLHLTGNPKRGMPISSYGEGLASVRIDNLKIFENGGNSLLVNKVVNDFDKTLFLKEANELVNKDKEYNLVLHNCEHFANSMTNKQKKSKQIQHVIYASTLGGLTSIISVISLHTLTGSIIIPFIVTSVSFVGLQYF